MLRTKGVYTKKEIVDLFHSLYKRGSDSECWKWEGTPQGNGQGLFTDEKGNRWIAHRFAFMVEKGRKPPSNLAVRHSCKTWDCVNPSHLYLGKPKIQMKKFTDDEIREIRKLGAGLQGDVDRIVDKYGIKVKPSSILVGLAERFGTTRQAIHQILTRRTYRDVE